MLNISKIMIYITGHHNPNWLAGNWGFISWEIKAKGLIVAIYWSIPFDRNLFSNELSVGLWHIDENFGDSKLLEWGDKKMFCVLCYGKLAVTKKFEEDLSSVICSKHGFKIEAKMDAMGKPGCDSKRHCDIKVVISPECFDDLAAEFPCRIIR